MTFTARKLFGSIGTPAQSPVDAETASPEYGAWYAGQMARAYAASRSAQTVIQLFCDMPRRDLPLAA